MGPAETGPSLELFRGLRKRDGKLPALKAPSPPEKELDAEVKSNRKESRIVAATGESRNGGSRLAGLLDI